MGSDQRVGMENMLEWMKFRGNIANNHGLGNGQG
jgi:hypothetical protein